MSETEWKKVDSLVRPQRFAMLIKKDTPYWQYISQNAIQVFTQLWGGAGFIMIPTDGNTIDDEFWNILENYSPDYLGVYNTSLRDLKTADPDQYNFQVTRIKDKWIAEGVDEDDAAKTINEQDVEISIDKLDISSTLRDELVSRLSPFHYSSLVEQHTISSGLVPDYPFTQVKNILGNSKQRPDVVYMQKELSDPIFNLMAKMRTGSMDEKLKEELENMEVHVSDLMNELSENEYLNIVERGEYNRLSQTLLENPIDLPENVASFMPEAVSLIGLGKYYRLLSGRDDMRNATVIIGDTLQDFCLAYSLSKMINDVHWMPDNILLKAYKDKQKTVRKRESGDESALYQDQTLIVRDLSTTYLRKIGFGYRDKSKLIITSASLNVAQLRSRKKKLLDMAYVGSSQKDRISKVSSPKSIQLKYVNRLMELNNYMNQQAMAFVDGKGTENIRPVKPKHFTTIDPQHHRWIQTSEVQDFKPPIISTIADDLLKNSNSHYEARVGVDGISFLMPGIAYWVGHDIDTTLQSPSINVLSSQEIFTHYFAKKFEVSLSDKGRYFLDTVNKFGSIESAARFFGNEKYTRLLAMFTLKPRKNEDELRKERIFLEQTSRAYLDYGKIKKALGRTVDAGSLINYLLSIKLLRRGLILRCSKCAGSAWYDNSLIGQEFECVRCMEKQLILKHNWKQPDEPNWYYSLAETTHQFYHHNGHITLLALNSIKGESKNFQYFPEMELHAIDGSNSRHEIDIACIKDGCIYLGEAKNRALLTSDLSNGGDMKKYFHLSKLSRPKPTIVIAVNHNSVSSSIRRKIKTKVDDADVLYLLKKDLFKVS